MDFQFSQEQEAFRATAREFAQRRLVPGYRERCASGKLEPELVREMGEMGLINVLLPEAYGGLGLDCVTAGLICEEIARGDLNAAYLPLLHHLMGQIVLDNGTEEQKAHWLPKMCSGEALMALALTEPHAGSDAAQISLKAEKEGENWKLTGEKTSISMADQAHCGVVFARTGQKEDGAQGISAFLVPMDLPGISRSRFDDAGTLSVGRGSIFFDGVTVPNSAMLGSEGKGFVQVMHGFDFSRALIGLMVIGVAAASLEDTWRYAQERTAFGSPLVRNEGVSFPLAEAETKLEAARLLCYKTLWLKDQGLPHAAEAAMCKWWGPQLAFEVLHQCVLLHGHAGYSNDYPHQMRMRDVMGLEIGDGTAQIMKIIIAREKAGRIAVPYK